MWNVAGQLELLPPRAHLSLHLSLSGRRRLAREPMPVSSLRRNSSSNSKISRLTGEREEERKEEEQEPLIGRTKKLPNHKTSEYNEMAVGQQQSPLTEQKMKHQQNDTLNPNRNPNEIQSPNNKSSTLAGNKLILSDQQQTNKLNNNNNTTTNKNPNQERTPPQNREAAEQVEEVGDQDQDQEGDERQTIKLLDEKNAALATLTKLDNMSLHNNQNNNNAKQTNANANAANGQLQQQAQQAALYNHRSAAPRPQVTPAASLRDRSPRSNSSLRRQQQVSATSSDSNATRQQQAKHQESSLDDIQLIGSGGRAKQQRQQIIDMDQFQQQQQQQDSDPSYDEEDEEQEAEEEELDERDDLSCSRSSGSSGTRNSNEIIMMDDDDDGHQVDQYLEQAQNARFQHSKIGPGPIVSSTLSGNSKMKLLQNHSTLHGSSPTPQARQPSAATPIGGHHSRLASHNFINAPGSSQPNQQTQTQATRNNSQQNLSLHAKLRQSTSASIQDLKQQQLHKSHHINNQRISQANSSTNKSRSSSRLNANSQDQRDQWQPVEQTNYNNNLHQSNNHSHNKKLHNHNHHQNSLVKKSDSSHKIAMIEGAYRYPGSATNSPADHPYMPYYDKHTRTRTCILILKFFVLLLLTFLLLMVLTGMFMAGKYLPKVFEDLMTAPRTFNVTISG